MYIYIEFYGYDIIVIITIIIIITNYLLDACILCFNIQFLRDSNPVNLKREV